MGPLPEQELGALLGSAAPPQLRRVAAGMAALAKRLRGEPDPAELTRWLDGIKPSYGVRFAPALCAAGYEDVDDLAVHGFGASERAARPRAYV